MKIDPTVERVRQARKKISEEWGNDPKKFIDYYMKYQKKFSGRLVRKPKVTFKK